MEIRKNNDNYNKVENTLVAKASNAFNNLINGLIDVFTGGNYKKTRILAIEQFKQNEAVFKLAKEIEKIQKDLDNKKDDILKLLDALKQLSKLNSEVEKSLSEMKDKVKIVDDVSKIENLKNIYKRYTEIDEKVNHLNSNFEELKLWSEKELNQYDILLKKNVSDLEKIHVKFHDLKIDIKKNRDNYNSKILKIQNYIDEFTQKQHNLISDYNKEFDRKMDLLIKNSNKTRKLVVFLFCFILLIYTMKFIIDLNLI